MNRLALPAGLAVFALLCYFPLFLHLDSLPLRLWDEARRAVNALEMVENGQWLVTHYGGKPEMWGTKPPLLIWCQALAMKAFGFNELAVRLPSALAALATVVALVLFSHRVLRRPWVGIFGSLVLLTTRGYVTAHGARSGDFDALLTLFLTVFLLSGFAFLHSEGRSRYRWLWLASAALTLGGLTKGVAGFFFVPGLVVYAWYRQQIPKVLTDRRVWLAAILPLLVVATFYLLREWQNPGYLTTVWSNELGGRYLASQEGHRHQWNFYFRMLARDRFLPWLYWLPLGLLLGWLAGRRWKDFTVLLGLNALLFLTILSFAQTRIIWYMAPVYPSLALLCGLAFDQLLRTSRARLAPHAGGLAIYILFGLAVIGPPYWHTVQRVMTEKLPAWDWEVLKYRDFMRRSSDVREYLVLHSRYNAHVRFYEKVYNRDGYQIRSQPLTDFYEQEFTVGEGPLELSQGQRVMVCEKSAGRALQQVYRTDTLRQWDTCLLLTVEDRK